MNLGERVLLMSLEQTHANQQGRFADAAELGERMVNEVKRVVNYGLDADYGLESNDE